jgi:hypothetical protein
MEDSKSRLCFEAQVDCTNKQSPQHYLKQAQAKLLQLKNEVDYHLKNLLASAEEIGKDVAAGTADASILETLKQMATNFLDSSAGSLPHKEYPFYSYIYCLFVRLYYWHYYSPTLLKHAIFFA